MARQSIHIVGASLAGIRAAEALRRREFDGRIVLIGDEPHRALRPAAPVQAGPGR